MNIKIIIVFNESSKIPWIFQYNPEIIQNLTEDIVII
jgi:hypothetical protein